LPAEDARSARGIDDVGEIVRIASRNAGPFSQHERDLFDDFTDYLNFFEYIAYLQERGQLDQRDVDAMFDYYLRSLKRHPEICEYAGQNGFERLKSLLATIEEAPKH